VWLVPREHQWWKGVGWEPTAREASVSVFGRKSAIDMPVPRGNVKKLVIAPLDQPERG
jgi:hypothetical protein